MSPSVQEALTVSRHARIAAPRFADFPALFGIISRKPIDHNRCQRVPDSPTRSCCTLQQQRDRERDSSRYRKLPMLCAHISTLRSPSTHFVRYMCPIVRVHHPPLHVSHPPSGHTRIPPRSMSGMPKCRMSNGIDALCPAHSPSLPAQKGCRGQNLRETFCPMG